MIKTLESKFTSVRLHPVSYFRPGTCEQCGVDSEVNAGLCESCFSKALGPCAVCSLVMPLVSEYYLSQILDTHPEVKGWCMFCLVSGVSEQDAGFLTVEPEKEEE